MPSTETIKIAEFELSPEASAVLEHMVATGLYGEDTSAALREIVAEGAARIYLQANELGVCPACAVVGRVNKLCSACDFVPRRTSRIR